MKVNNKLSKLIKYYKLINTKDKYLVNKINIFIRLSN